MSNQDCKPENNILSLGNEYHLLIIDGKTARMEPSVSLETACKMLDTQSECTEILRRFGSGFMPKISETKLITEPIKKLTK